MKRIGGNITVELQVRTTTENELGEQVEQWETVDTLIGFLDSSGGTSNYTPYDAKIQESTNLFVCDYKELDPRIKIENTRIFIPKTAKYYDVMLIDNPLERNYHYEIFLKYTGGQNGTI